MRKESFNDNWKYRREGGDAEWQAVTLPHDAMLCEKRGPGNPGGVNVSWFESGDYVYEKAFIAPEENAGKKTVFEFEGVYRNAEVYINGALAASRPYGYTNFYVDATPYLNFGKENIIKVRARNADQPNSRWYTGAGLYRPVQMYVLPEKHIELNGIKIKSLGFTLPKIGVTLLTSAPGSAAIEILDGEEVIKTVETPEGQAYTEIELPGAKLWDCENPKLYTCRVTFGEDVSEERFGIRIIECGAKEGFKINGKRVILRGACFHHDNGLLGAAGHPFAERRKVRLLKEAGYNALRSAHNPCSKSILEACDELGMLMMDEYVDMWYIHKTKYDYADYFDKWWRQDLHDMVDKDFNHPSVIMYSIGNEVSETGQEKGIKLTGEMTEYLHELDASRPVTCGVNIFFNYLSSLGFGIYSDKKAAKTAKANKKEKHKSVGSEFFNKLAGLLGAKFMKFGATLRGSDKRTRDAFAKLDVAGYNYGINRYKKDLINYPDRVIVGSETFCADAYKAYDLMEKHPALIGDFVWAGMDYLGEAGIGAWEYKDCAPDFSHGPGWITAGSGRLDITGRGSGEAAYTRVAMGLDALRMAVVPADNAENSHSPSAWKMSNARESWSWEGCEGKKTVVEVYTKAYEAAVFINGKKAGAKRVERNGRVYFDVTYEPGEITAVAYDNMKRQTAHSTLRSAGKETKLAILPEDANINAETELCYVRLQYTDKTGTEKPLTKGKIKVAAENGTLIALGHGCPYNESGYLNPETDTYYGEALAIIKPDGNGPVKIKTESMHGSAEAEIKVL